MFRQAVLGPGDQQPTRWTQEKNRETASENPENLVGTHRAQYPMGGILAGGVYSTPNHSILPSLSALSGLQDRDPSYLSAE